MMINESLAGSKTEEVAIKLSEEMVREYSEAIGSSINIFGEQNAGNSDKQFISAAPATMTFIFWQFINAPWLENIGPLIHGKQQFLLNEPLYAGRTYYCTVELTKVIRKGNRQFLEHVLEVKHNNKAVARSISTFVLLESEAK